MARPRMPAFDDDFLKPPIKKTTHDVGQDLSRLSVDELHARIDLLREEVARIEQEIRAKTQQRSAADALFRS